MALGLILPAAISNMDKNRMIRRTQQSWHPASDHSSPRTGTPSLESVVARPPPVVLQPYRNEQAPIQQNYDIEASLIADPAQYFFSLNQVLEDIGNTVPPQLDHQQYFHDWNRSMPTQGNGITPGDELPTLIAGNAQPALNNFEGSTLVEDEEEHLKWTLPKEVLDDTQNSSEDDEATPVRYLACPFYKHNPEYFSKPKWKSCAHPGYQNMHRLKSVSVCFLQCAWNCHGWKRSQENKDGLEKARILKPSITGTTSNGATNRLRVNHSARTR